MITFDKLVDSMKGRDLVKEGSRNNDMVNLSIISVIEYGLPSNGEKLLANILKLINEQGFQLVDNCDYGYMEEKADIIFPYLEDWDARGILSYTIE